MRSLVLVAFLLAILPENTFADSRSSCPECTVEPNGPAATSKEAILRAIPPLSQLTKLCPGAEKESTMFLSPYQVETDRFYILQLSFIFGPDAESVGALSTLYSSYFIYARNPGEPLLIVTYLAMRDAAWANELQKRFSGAPADVLFSSAAGRYLVLVRPTQTVGSAECFRAAGNIFQQQLKLAADEIGSEEPQVGPLKGIVFAGGTVLDTTRVLSDEELSALGDYRKSLYAVSASQGLTRNGSAILGEYTEVEQVSLGPTQLSAQDLEAIGSLSKLRILKLGSNGISDAMMTPLGKLKALQSLSLRKNPIGTAGVKALVPLANLQHLALGGTQISDPTLEVLAQMTQLRWLFLHNTAVTDKGIAALRTLSKLEYLTLNGTQATDASIDTLAKLPMLKTVVLRDTRVTNEGRSKLASGKIRVE